MKSSQFASQTTINGSPSPNKFKFKSKISFFNDKESFTTLTRNTQQKETLKLFLEQLQDRTKFYSLSEYNTIPQSQITIAILHSYNPKFNSAGSDITQQTFNQTINEIQLNIIRKLPFIKIINKQLSSTDNHAKNTNYFLQVQIYTPNLHQAVLYQTFPKEPLPPSKLIIDLISLYLAKFTLVIDVDCPDKKVSPILEKENNLNILNDLKVTIRQRESLTVDNYNKNSIIIKSVNLNLFNDQEQTQIMSQPTTDLTEQKDQNMKVNKQKSLPVKLFTQTNYTNENGQVQFNDLITQINNYEVEISGEKIKSSSSYLQVNELIDPTTLTIKMIIKVDRSDLVKCYLQVVNQENPIKECNFKISQDPQIQPQECTLQYDQSMEAFYFYGLQQKHYYISVSRHDCFTNKKIIFLSGASSFFETIQLVSCIQTSLVFKTVNLIEGHTPIPNVHLEINQTDNGQLQQQQGKTNSKGLFTCSGLMFKTMQVRANVKGFLTIPLEFDVKAQSTGAILNIPMIPDYYCSLNQYHILVYVPNKNDFMLRFKLQCPDDEIIWSKQKSHSESKIKLEQKNLTQKTMLYNFSIHVSSLNPFLKNNDYSLIIENDINPRKLLCAGDDNKKVSHISPKESFNETMFKSNTNNQNTNPLLTRSAWNINEQFLKTKLYQNDEYIQQQQAFIGQRKKYVQNINLKIYFQFSIENSIRVFICYGSQVFQTFLIQTNLIYADSSSVLATLDLNKRKITVMKECLEAEFKKDLRSIPLKKDPTYDPNKGQEINKILSQITNHL